MPPVQQSIQSWAVPQAKQPVIKKPAPKQAQNDDDDSADELSDPSQPVIEPAFMTAEQKAMLDCLERDDYIGLLDCIAEADKQKAVKLSNSRIPDDQNWRDAGAFLLLQRPKEVLRAVLNNTLPQQRFSRKQVRGPGSTKASGVDPVIYINCIADAKGRGLTRAEYAQVLDMMMLTTGSASNAAAEKARDKLNEVYHRIINTDADFFSTPVTSSTFKQNTTDFVKFNRDHVLKEAEKQKINHLLFKFECGWACKGYDRCDQHKRLTGSPDVFRLAQLVVRYLYRDRRFKLHQYILFDVLQGNQASIGESIGSHLCSSYSTYGGFNGAQAGIHDSSSRQFTDADWTYARQNVLDNGYMDDLMSNYEACSSRYHSEMEQDDIKLEALAQETRLNEYRESQQEILAEIEIKSEALNAQNNQILASVQDLEKARRKEEETARQFLSASEHIKELAMGMSLLVPNSQIADHR